MDSMDDAAIVKHVLSNRSSYYRILFLDSNATADQIKVAYKKMALKCHPDKNKHTQASEAFKIVGTANATLSDATKRRIYDTRGVEGVRRHESGSGAAGGAPRRYQQRQANDFFEEFFGRAAGGGAGGMHNAHGPHVYEAEFNANILMLAPLLIFLFLAILLQSSFTDLTEPPVRGGRHNNNYNNNNNRASSVSLTPDPALGLVVERVAAVNGARVKYYVARGWAEQAARGHIDIKRVERDVLQQQREYLARRCEAESLSFRARGRKDTPPVCVEHEKFARARR